MSPSEEADRLLDFLDREADAGNISLREISCSTFPHIVHRITHTEWYVRGDEDNRNITIRSWSDSAKLRLSILRSDRLRLIIEKVEVQEAKS